VAGQAEGAEVENPLCSKLGERWIKAADGCQRCGGDVAAETPVGVRPAQPPRPFHPAALWRCVALSFRN